MRSACWVLSQGRFLLLSDFTLPGENLTQSSVESIPPDIVPQESVTSLSLGEEDTAQKEGALVSLDFSQFFFPPYFPVKLAQT